MKIIDVMNKVRHTNWTGNPRCHNLNTFQRKRGNNYVILSLFKEIFHFEKTWELKKKFQILKSSESEWIFHNLFKIN